MPVHHAISCFTACLLQRSRSSICQQAGLIRIPADEFKTIKIVRNDRSFKGRQRTLKRYLIVESVNAIPSLTKHLHVLIRLGWHRLNTTYCLPLPAQNEWLPVLSDFEVIRTSVRGLSSDHNEAVLRWNGYQFNQLWI